VRNTRVDLALRDLRAHGRLEPTCFQRVAEGGPPCDGDEQRGEFGPVHQDGIVRPLRAVEATDEFVDQLAKAFHGRVVDMGGDTDAPDQVLVHRISGALAGEVDASR
jgi:hypothetical protein